MKKERKEKRIILFLLIGVVLMTVGFATYSGWLNIDGTVNVKSSKWSIGYVLDSYKETTGSVAATSKSVTADTYTFATTLSKPGEFYEATVNVENAGTFDAKVTGIEMSALSEAQAKYLTYTVTYDGNTYSATDSALNSALSAGDTKPLVVRVTYVQPDDSADLPQSDVEIEVTGKLTYAIDQ